MQKKLIALAVAAVTSGAAFAQSNVTIYGNVDMGMMFRQGSNGAVASGQSQYDLQSAASQSHIGFKGVEDLGNGLKALFDLQYRISPDTNTGLATAGRQYVGLTGGFGTAVAGYLDGIRFGIYGKYNPFGNYSVASMTSMTTQYDRAANAVAYISPSFSGFTVILATATNTQGAEGSLNSVHSPAKPSGGNTGDDRLLSANLIYANGPLSIDLDYETTRAVGYDRDRLYVATAGASYDFGVVKVSGLYDVIKGDANSFIGGNTTFAAAAFGLAANQRYDRRNWFLGATVPYGKAKFLAMFGQVKDKTLSDADAWKVGVGARYALSKRTELYADYAHIKNDTNGKYTINPMGNGAGTSVGINGLAMGIKHSF
ncbi:MAG: porin [Azonexus sp.]|nr:porin [Azonexus sp.]